MNEKRLGSVRGLESQRLASTFHDQFTPKASGHGQAGAGAVLYVASLYMLVLPVVLPAGYGAQVGC